jgi:8-oxo-dGTP pyrophosphatase MutT (NUDIX family)
MAPKLNASFAKLFTARRAAVAAVLRRGGLDGSTLELLLIQRVASPADRWSGHVALPGGVVQPGESELDAALRETSEEVGLELGETARGGGAFELIGQLDDRLATRSLGVATFVFRERPPREGEPPRTAARPALRLQASEVACAWWVPIEWLCAEAVEPAPVAAAAYLPAALRARPWLVAWLRVGTAHVPAVPIRTAVAAGAPVASGLTDRAPFLWGLTFGIVSELRASLGLRALAPAGRRRPDVAFRPSLHPANCLLVLLRAAHAVRSMLAARALAPDAPTPGAGPRQ